MLGGRAFWRAAVSLPYQMQQNQGTLRKFKSVTLYEWIPKAGAACVTISLCFERIKTSVLVKTSRSQFGHIFNG